MIWMKFGGKNQKSQFLKTLSWGAVFKTLHLWIKYVHLRSEQFLAKSTLLPSKFLHDSRQEVRTGFLSMIQRTFLLSTSWRCAETLQISSGHGCHNTHQVWSEYVKALRRYSLMSTVTCSLSNLFTNYLRTIWLINLIFITFHLHDLKMISLNFVNIRQSMRSSKK